VQKDQSYLQGPFARATDEDSQLAKGGKGEGYYLLKGEVRMIGGEKPLAETPGKEGLGGVVRDAQRARKKSKKMKVTIGVVARGHEKGRRHPLTHDDGWGSREQGMRNIKGV